MQWLRYVHLARVHQPIGYALLLWPTLWGLWVGFSGMPPWPMLLVFVAGVLVTRSAGCIINDMADRDIDQHVVRTAQRPLANGTMTMREAWCCLGVLCAVAGGLAISLGMHVMLWGLPAVALMVLYPFAKRWFFCPQLFLSLAFSWSVVLAWRVSGQPMTAPLLWWLFAANVFWTVAYDTLYAMADKPEDLQLRMHSFAITLGEHDHFGVGVCYALMMTCWCGVLYRLAAPASAWLCFVLAACDATALWWSCRARCPQACFAAFLANARVGAWLWLAAAATFVF